MKTGLNLGLGMVLLSGLFSQEAMACKGMAGDLCLPVELQVAAEKGRCPLDMKEINYHEDLIDPEKVVGPFVAQRNAHGNWVVPKTNGWALCDNTREMLSVMNTGHPTQLSAAARNYLTQFQNNACELINNGNPNLKYDHPELAYPELNCSFVAQEAKVCNNPIADNLCLPFELQIPVHGSACPRGTKKIENYADLIDPIAHIAHPFFAKKNNNGRWVVPEFPGWVLCDNTLKMVAFMNRHVSTELSEAAKNYLTHFQNNACKLKNTPDDLHYPELRCRGDIAREATACNGKPCLPLELQFAARGSVCPNENMKKIDNYADLIDPTVPVVEPFYAKEDDEGKWFIPKKNDYVLCDNSREKLAAMNSGGSTQLSAAAPQLSAAARRYLNQFQNNACKLKDTNQALNYRELSCPLLPLVPLIKDKSNYELVLPPPDLGFTPAFATVKSGGGYLFWSSVMASLGSNGHPPSNSDGYCFNNFNGARLPTKDDFIALSQAMGSIQPLWLRVPNYIPNVAGYDRSLIPGMTTRIKFWSRTNPVNSSTQWYVFDGYTGIVDDIAYYWSHPFMCVKSAP